MFLFWRSTMTMPARPPQVFCRAKTLNAPLRERPLRHPRLVSGIHTVAFVPLVLETGGLLLVLETGGLLSPDLRNFICTLARTYSERESVGQRTHVDVLGPVLYDSFLFSAHCVISVALHEALSKAVGLWKRGILDR